MSDLALEQMREAVEWLDWFASYGVAEPDDQPTARHALTMARRYLAMMEAGPVGWRTTDRNPLEVYGEQGGAHSWNDDKPAEEGSAVNTQPERFTEVPLYAHPEPEEDPR